MILKRLVAASLLVGVSLFAEMEDKWAVKVGGMYVTTFETDMQIGKEGVPIGAKINTKDQLGLESDSVVLRLDGYYRFNDTHSVEASYFAARSDSHKTIQKDIEWDDSIIEAGATIDSYFDMDVFKINYGYSFYHNDDVELMLTAGLHITKIDLGLTAEGTVDGEEGRTSTSSSTVTAPLPIVGFKGEYTILPHSLFVTYKADIFYLSFGDFQGSILSNGLDLEYEVTEHVGVGMGFDSTIINVISDDNDKKVEVENKLFGLLFYVSYTY